MLFDHARSAYKNAVFQNASVVCCPSLLFDTKVNPLRTRCKLFLKFLSDVQVKFTGVGHLQLVALQKGANKLEAFYKEAYTSARPFVQSPSLVPPPRSQNIAPGGCHPNKVHLPSVSSTHSYRCYPSVKIATPLFIHNSRKCVTCESQHQLKVERND